MSPQLSTLASVLATATVGAWTILLCSWRTAIADETYRPEAHYMRGPGPKWYAKHARGHEPALR